MGRLWRRWPWRAAPGMVWVSSRRLIALQAGALHVHAVEAEIRAVDAERRGFVTRARARELLADALPVSPAVREELMADLPLTAEGVLHEQAFAALVADRVWAERERALQTWVHHEIDASEGA